MRLRLLQSLGLLGAFALFAVAQRRGEGGLRACAEAAWGGAETASSVCAGAAASLFGGLALALLLVGALVNLIDYYRFRTLGAPPLRRLLATIATAATALAVLSLLPAGLKAIAATSSLPAALLSAWSLLRTLALVLAAALGVTAALAIWLAPRAPEEGRSLAQRDSAQPR